ncbi:MAG: organic solvent tolerance ABC transporter substrate-binding protein [Candidatus Rokuibacteriota bacterium]|nr:MAG: organic solvent tolerance ABC transporter substrate-binding protein [Candidatus Rokubacteria bacterium]PYO03889.1 MAG: organic solvent tolerance ABC transporter substrate-binding protein [Candidatus Rokubacteria bacterium]
MTKVLAAWFLVASAAASPAVMPRDVVQGAVARVIATLEEAKFNQPGEVLTAVGPNAERVRGEIRRIATDLFDFDEVARRALSRHWAGRTRAEQTEFTSLFTDLLERSYVGKIETYSGEKIVYTGEVVDGNYATVRSRIITRRRTDTALDYRMHEIDGRWKVYDVLIDGVSFVSTYRSEFNRVIQSSSYEELIERLRKKRIDVLAVSGKS